MRNLQVVLVVLGASVGVLACSGAASTVFSDGGVDGGSTSSSSASSTSSTSSSGTSGTTSSSSTSSSSSSGGTMCNALTQSGTQVTVVGSTSNPPTATGGTISDGTYVLNQGVYFSSAVTDGMTVATVQETIQISGGTVQSISTGASGDSRETGTITASGNQLTITTSCQFPVPDSGATPPSVATYSASATELAIFITNNGATLAESFSKQ